MNISFLIQEKIRHTLAECELHQKRIRYSAKKISVLFPVDVNRYRSLTDEEVEALDQFLFRFCKLQDTIEQRLFNEVLEFLKEPVKSLSFLDKVNRFEQLNIISEKNDWLILRDIRNRVSHEYESDVSSMCEALNHIYSNHEKLMLIFLNIKRYLSNYPELAIV